jgi:hypothetical protein
VSSVGELKPQELNPRVCRNTQFVSSHGELKTQQTEPKSFAETKKPTMQAFLLSPVS